MSLRYADVLTFIIVILLTGCASTPPQQALVPGIDATAGVTETITDVEGEFQSALQLMKAEDWHAAADRLAAITAAEPGLSGPWTNLGIARNKTGDTAGAEAAFRKAIDANARQFVACNELGMLYRRRGRLQEAAAMYHQGLKINPNAGDIHWNLAILHDRYLANPAQALVHYERYQQLTQSEDKQLLSWIRDLREQVNQVNVASGAKQ
jgi:Tfp pilus assembly protein PilF